MGLRNLAKVSKQGSKAKARTGFVFSNLNGSAKQPSKPRNLGPGAKGQGKHLDDSNGCSEVYRPTRGDPQGRMVQSETLPSLGPQTSL